MSIYGIFCYHRILFCSLQNPIERYYFYILFLAFPKTCTTPKNQIHLEKNVALVQWISHEIPVLITGVRLPQAAYNILHATNIVLQLFLCTKKPRDFSRGFSSNVRMTHLGEIILRPLFSCQSQVILNLQGVTCLLH